jgi:serine/threonine protein kinase
VAPYDDIRRAAGRRGRYQLFRPVGANRFASLWNGEDTETGEPVLVEVIRSTPPPDPEDAKMLRDRMAATQDLPHHPGLLPVRSIYAPEPPGKLSVAARAAGWARARRGVEEQQWLLVLDPFDGSTLDHRVAFGDLSTAAVCAVAARVGEALSALHTFGVVHGSVSATSVLVSDDGDVRLIDAIVGSWWTEPAASAGDVDRRQDDVLALARLVSDLLSPVAVPLTLRPVLRSANPSLDELAAALREAGAPVLGRAASARTEPAGPVVDVREPASGPEPVRVPEPDGTATGASASTAERPRSSTAPRATTTSDPRIVTLPDASTTDTPTHPSETIRSLPERPPTATSHVDWLATPGTARARQPELAAPSTRARDRSADGEIEPALWMKIAAVIASLVMFAAVGAAVYYFIQSS